MSEYGRVLGVLADDQMALDRMQKIVNLMVEQAQEAGIDPAEASFILAPSFRHQLGTILTPVGWHGWRESQPPPPPPGG